MANLYDLPNELLLMIMKELEAMAASGRSEEKRKKAWKEMVSFIHLDRRLYRLCRHALYRADAAHNDPVALVWGALHGNIPMMQCAIEAGTSLDTVLAQPERVRMRACKYRYGNLGTDTLRRVGLLEPLGIAFHDETGYRYGSALFPTTPLFFAVANRQYEAVRWMLRNGAEIDSTILGNTNDPTAAARRTKWLPMACAVWMGDLDMVKTLFDEGASLTKLYLDSSSEEEEEEEEGCITALHLAAAKGHMRLLDFLMQHKGCDDLELTGLGKTPLHYAVSATKNGRMMMELIHRGAQSRVDGIGDETGPILRTARLPSPLAPQCALFEAMSVGCYANALELLKSGMCRGLSRGIARRMVAHTFDQKSTFNPTLGPRGWERIPEEKDNDRPGRRWSAIDRRRLIEYLFISNYVDVKDEISDGMNALMMAAQAKQFRSRKLVQFLVDRPGADINQRRMGSNGDTVLHQVVRNMLRDLVSGTNFNTSPLENFEILTSPPGNRLSWRKPDCLAMNASGKTMFDLVHEYCERIIVKTARLGEFEAASVEPGYVLLENLLGICSKALLTEEQVLQQRERVAEHRKRVLAKCNERWKSQMEVMRAKKALMSIDHRYLD
ncbi:hypothetical protein OQA88_10754 [Cercophora sp. LCS_1]